MKKQLLLLVMMLLPLVASANEVEIDGIFYNLTSKTRKAEVIKSPNKYSGSIIIPDSIKYEDCYYKVTEIGKDAFFQCKDLNDVTLPNTITSIGGRSFGETNIKNIVIPNSVVSIGYEAFDNCHYLDSVVIPNSVKDLGDMVFHACVGLTSIVISEGVSSLGFGVFMDCQGLVDVSLPSTITAIPDHAFNWCTNLSSLTIPKSIRSIGSGVFYLCKKLKSIYISDLEAWCNIYNSSNYVWDDDCIEVGHDLYLNGEKITELVIPNNIKSIGKGAFKGCSGLTKVLIHNDVATIENEAFKGCSQLKEVSIGWGVSKIRQEAFSNCKELTDIYCYTEDVPNTEDTGFKDSYIEYSTLHVREKAYNKYKESAPWSGFKEIVKIEIPKHRLLYYVDGEIYKSFELEEGTTIEPENNPYKEGYTFSGWSEIPQRMLYDDIVVTGSFTINTYKLTYYVDGVKYKSYDVEYGANITPEEEPTKEGFTFSGWSEIPETMPSHNVTITGTFTPSQKCDKPAIHYEYGRLTFTCDTEGVEYVSEITDSDIKKHYESEITLTATYNISVYAKKDGFAISDVSTATLCWIDVEPNTEGITDGIAQVPAKAVLIQTDGGSIKVQGADNGTQVRVYNINGSQAGSAISQNGVATINTTLQSGSVAIVKVGKKSVKVMMK